MVTMRNRPLRSEREATLKPPQAQNRMDHATRHTALTVAAVLSFYTARSIRLDNESSKLLLLSPQ